MPDHWQLLVANLAVVALFISAWVHGHFIFASRPRAWRSLAFGAVMGAGAVASMMLAIQVNGALFDLRTSLIAIAAFFGGPLAALVAVAIAFVYRVAAIGGPTGVASVIGMAAAAAAGLLVSMLTRRRIPDVFSALILAAAVGLANLGFTMLFLSRTSLDARLFSEPVSATNAIATLLSALFIMRSRVVDRERDLLGAAFVEAPDFQYVKTPDSRFAAVNAKVAQLHGFASPVAMIGKTDFDITDAERAKALIAGEQKLVRTGEPQIDFEELVPDSNDEDVWYLTSKVPLHNSDGEVIGIAGVTRDITAQKRLRQELVEGRNLLDYVLSGVSDGIAMYDRQGTLAYCNEQFSSIFPLTSAVRRRGQHIRDILQAVVETGEQKGIPEVDQDKWIDRIAATLMEPGEQEVELFDGRWLHIRTRPTSDQSSLVVVSDVTKIKQVEAALVSMTDQLKLLATTDGLTGLTNRRAFDIALENEVSRSRRTGQPLTLLMIDVDRFKSYNDLYGHQAGDEVLKTIARCLKAAIKRPSDVAARYGGEEFIAILPDTDEDGAFFIADAFREGLHALSLPHTGGDKGVVTASVGISAFADRDHDINASELVRRADEALYNAKDAGRDRVTGWRPRHGIKPVRAHG
jgi:diguanylate cyclase (GGDEF)-like protein/PAS domain S-box-containing protein